jgi:hypothetical protein
MVYAFVVLFLLIPGLSTWLWVTFNKLSEMRLKLAQSQSEAQALLDKYKDVLDLEGFKEDLSRQIAALQSQATDAKSLNETLSTQAQAIKRQLELYNAEQTVIDCGLYTPVYDFDISQKYKDALDQVREEQKAALKAGTAAVCSQTWSVNGNVKEGAKQTKYYIQLMLRAFNGESDALIANVRWNNVDRMIQRLEGDYQAINKLGEPHTSRIERNYFQLKLKELRLMYEYQEKLKAEKDEQRRIQEQAREDARVEKEHEQKIREADEEEKRSRLALEQARQQLEAQHGAVTAQMTEKIQQLERSLAEASANKERAISRAQMTKAGNVYIISNLGSFGETRFKIGMTRRDKPEDRIFELGNASVPFEFDVHAMIPTNNAPQLESALHDRLKSKMVNLVRNQKEFFDVTLDEIDAVLKDLAPGTEVKRIYEARSYRESLEIRARQSTHKEQAAASANGQQVYVLNNGAQEGPYSFDEINEKLTAGHLDPATTQLWYSGLPKWKPLSYFQAN